MSDASSVFFQVDRVHDPMDERSQDKRCGADEQQARKEGIRRSEQFACVRGDRINRSHTAENHRGVHEGIDPRQATKAVVAQNANAKGNTDRHGRERQEPDDSPEKAMAGKQRIGAMFKHARYRTFRHTFRSAGGIT